MPTPNRQLPNLELTSVLGQGGTSTVYLARQISTQRAVAVKVLDANFVQTREDIDRFLNEAKACARFHHPNIVRVYDSGETDGIYYFVMEYIRGYTFGTYLARKQKVDIEDVLIITESITAALAYAWQKFKVVHCDIKPDNIMVDADGTIKLMDLGIARSLLTAKAETSEEILGTPTYISPDQAYDLPDLDCRADIYSLGATIYHLLTGRMLFPNRTDQQVVDCHVGTAFARDPRAFIPTLPQNFSIMLNRMLAKDRRLRYPNWETLAEDIKRLYAGTPLLATPLQPGESSVSCMID